MKNQKSYGSTRTQHKYSKIKSIDIKDVKRIKSKFSNDKNRNIIFTLLKNSDRKLERSKKESYKESRRQKPSLFTSLSGKNKSMAKHKSTLNPHRRNTENYIKSSTVFSGAEQIIEAMDVTDHDSFYRNQNSKMVENRNPDCTLDAIEDKWEALLKEFELNNSAFDGRIQSGKIFNKGNHEKSNITMAGERHTSNNDKNELSFAFEERMSEKGQVSNFRSFNKSSLKNNKLARKKVSPDFNLEEEMRRINESYHITGLEKQEEEKKQGIQKPKNSRVYTGNVKRKPKQDKAKLIQDKYKKLYASSKGKICVIEMES